MKYSIFYYLSFCKHLDLMKIQIMANIIHTKSKKLIIQYEIFNLFINKNTKFTHLYIPKLFNYQIHLIPEAKYCFSEIEFLFCNTDLNGNILNGLTEICKSIKELELVINNYENNGIIR